MNKILGNICIRSPLCISLAKQLQYDKLSFKNEGFHQEAKNPKTGVQWINSQLKTIQKQLAWKATLVIVDLVIVDRLSRPIVPFSINFSRNCRITGSSGHSTSDGQIHYYTRGKCTLKNINKSEWLRSNSQQQNSKMTIEIGACRVVLIVEVTGQVCLNLNNYFNLYICLSYHFCFCYLLWVQKLAPIPEVVSQNITNKSCFSCV